MEADQNTFLQQFGGSATANLVSAVLFILYKFIEGRCKHSKCSSNTSCFKCAADNYATQRGSSLPRIKNNVRSEEGMSKLQRGVDKEVQTRHLPPLAIMEPESRENTREFDVVRGPDLV